MIFQDNQTEEDPLSSVSDLMSGLMIIFLFISIAYMHNVKQEEQHAKVMAERIKQIAITYDKTKVKLNEALHKAFDEELKGWAIIATDTLSVRFFNPEILFETGKSDVKEEFKRVLDNFFPKYLEILTSEQFKSDISEIRIEGHTSSEWGSNDCFTEDESYFKNMELSQARTRSVLEYCYSIKDSRIDKIFMKKYVTANGLSFSKLVYSSHGKEDKKKSRRVEFRTITNAEEKIAKILED